MPVGASTVGDLGHSDTYHAEVLCCVEHRGPDCLCCHCGGDTALGGDVFGIVLVVRNVKVLLSLYYAFFHKQNEDHDEKRWKSRVDEQTDRQTAEWLQAGNQDRWSSWVLR